MKQLEAIDLGAHFFFQSLRRPWLDRTAESFTHVGDVAVVCVFAVAAALVFFLDGRCRIALALAVAGVLELTIVESVKQIVQRDRPPDVTNPVVLKPHSYSFPSGHAAGSMAIYGSIGLGLAQLMRSRRARVFVIACGFTLGFVIGLTRLYLGVHFLFDVVGGWTVGVACALFGHWVNRRFCGDTPV